MRRGRVGSRYFQRVVEEVGEDLAGLDIVAAAGRKRLDADFRLGLRELEFHRGENLAEEAIDVERADGERDAAEARVAQQAGEERLHFRDAGIDEAQRRDFDGLTEALGGDVVALGQASAAAIVSQARLSCLPNPWTFTSGERRSWETV